MARSNYQYETSPRKIEPDYRKSKKRKKVRIKVLEDLPRQNVKISKERRQKQRTLTLTVIALFFLLLTISYRNSQINEKFSNVQNLKQELSSLEKENEQLKVGIENSLNLNTIEKLAKEKLGMQKLTNKQTLYVDLPKKDYTEPATEKIIKEEKSWFEEFVGKLFKLE